MAIKPTKASFSLSANIKNVRQPVNLTILNLNTGASSLSSEGQETAENANARERFKELYKSGLNPLKAHLVANTEFVPVSTVAKESSDVSTINLNFGEESSITVTNVAKLITLHRQIREYMLNTAEEMLSRVEDFHVPAFHMCMHFLLGTGIKTAANKPPRTSKKAKNKYSRQRKNAGISPSGVSVMNEKFIADGKFTSQMTLHKMIVIANKRTGAVSVEKTIDKILDTLRRLPENSVLISKTEGKGAATGNRLRRFNAGNLNIDSDYTSLVRIVKNKKDDALIRSLVEYIVYEVVVGTAISYMSGILRLKDELDDAYSFTSNHRINNSQEVTDHPIFRKYFSHTSFQKNARVKPDVKATGMSIVREHLGFKFHDGAGDIEELLNIITTLASRCLLLDSSRVILDRTYASFADKVNSAAGKSYEDAYSGTPDNSVFTQWSGDLARAMSTLRKVSWEGAVIQGEEHTVKRKASQKFTKETMRGIEAILDAQDLHHHRYGEMLAAIAFDSVYELTGRAPLDLDLPKLLPANASKLKGSDGTRRGEATITSYLHWALGELIPMTIADSEFLPEAPMPDKITGARFNQISPLIANKGGGRTKNYGALGAFLTDIKKSNDGVPYIPLESRLGKLQLRPNTASYYTGPEHFIDKALQEGDTEFKEFSEFIDR